MLCILIQKLIKFTFVSIMKGKHNSSVSGQAFVSNRTVQSNRRFEDHYFTRENKPKNKTENKPESPDAPQEFGNCNICGKMTGQCCSLCMKAFYCSSEHQQADWHIKHKFSCQGNSNKEEEERKRGEEQRAKQNFIFYTKKPDPFSMDQSEENEGYYTANSSVNKRQKEQYYLLKKKEEEKNLNEFLELIEQRLIIRQKILKQSEKLSNDRTPLIVREAIVRSAEELLNISAEITKKHYQPSYAKKKISASVNENGKIIAFHLQANFDSGVEEYTNEVPLAINDVGLLIQYVADHVMLINLYHNAGMKNQAKNLVICLGRLLEESDQEKTFLKTPQINSYNDPNFSAEDRAKSFESLLTTKLILLKSIIRISQLYQIDKTTEIMYKLFIKLIEKYEGIWETIYAYFNIGVWYSKKTYYQKSIKAFMFCQGMLDSHKKNYKEGIVFKGDVLFNLGLAYWMIGEQALAVQNMQESYKNRVNGIGKNSIEASYCLEQLAKWFKTVHKWQQCIQYLEECHRIRKQYQQSEEELQSLNSIKLQIKEVYMVIKQQKMKRKKDIDPQSLRHYEKLIENQNRENEQQIIKEEDEFEEETVTKRLFFPQQEEMIDFQIKITPEMIETYSSQQVEYLNLLFDLTDQKMHRDQAIRTITQSPLYQSLLEDQKAQFIEVNDILH